MKRREFIPKYDHANFVFSTIVITIYVAVDLAQFLKINADIEFYADLFSFKIHTKRILFHRKAQESESFSSKNAPFSFDTIYQKFSRIS